MKPFLQSVKYLIFLGSVFVVLACDSDDGIDPGFADPPDTYYLVEEVVVIDDGDNTSADLNPFTYNDQGKLSGDGIFYDRDGRLIQSPWPNRVVMAGLYYYDNDVADSIVTYGHPSYTLYYAIEYDQERPSQIRIYRRSTGEINPSIIDELVVNYLSDNQIQVVSENRVLDFELDNGRNPYPYEYRLSHWWWPYSQNIFMILTERNVLRLTITTDGEVTNEIEYSYEYNEFGFPTRATRGNRSLYYKYSETLN